MFEIKLFVHKQNFSFSHCLMKQANTKKSSSAVQRSYAINRRQKSCQGQRCHFGLLLLSFVRTSFGFTSLVSLNPNCYPTTSEPIFFFFYFFIFFLSIFFMFELSNLSLTQDQVSDHFLSSCTESMINKSLIHLSEDDTKAK